MSNLTPNPVLDRDASILWARDLLQRTDWLILDSETTGLFGDIEMVQLGILAPSGHTLLDVLLWPSNPIPSDASAIHGITNEHVADALAFPDIYPVLSRIVHPRPHTMKHIVIYNAAYDTRVLNNLCEKYALPNLHFQWTRYAETGSTLPKTLHCAMERYAAFVGEWSNHFGNYSFQRLPGGTHQAIGDCRAVLKLIHVMAAAPLSTEPMQLPPATDMPASEIDVNTTGEAFPF